MVGEKGELLLPRKIKSVPVPKFIPLNAPSPYDRYIPKVPPTATSMVSSPEIEASLAAVVAEPNTMLPPDLILILLVPLVETDDAES